MNKIIWKDIESTEIKGLMICELPPITKPKMRVQETTIDGVDGSIIEELGYESYDKTITIALTKNYDIDEVIEYFTGEGNVTFSNEPERYYKARIIEQIDFERLLRYRTAEVTFRVQPFKYEYQEGISRLNLHSQEGEFVSINKNDIKLTQVKVDGECEQETTQGYNLYNNEYKISDNGVTSTKEQIENGIKLTITTITSTGSQYGFYLNIRTIIDNLGLADGDDILIKYKFKTTNTSSFNQNFGNWEAGKNQTWSPSVSQTYTSWTERSVLGKFNATAQYGQFSFYSPNISVGDVYEIKDFMISKSSVDLPYEQYTGGSASPNPDYPKDISVISNEIQLKSTGKNLFNLEEYPFINKVAYNSSGEQVFWSGYCGIQEYFPVEENTTYTYSNSTSKNIEYGLVYYDENKNILSHTITNTKTFTTPTNCKYIRFAMKSDTLPIWVQIEEGSTATDYEPYKESTSLVSLNDNELCSIGDIKDELIIENGKSKIIKRIGKVVLNGSENWVKSTSTTENYFVGALSGNNLLNLFKSKKNRILCTHISKSGNIGYEECYCFYNINSEGIFTAFGLSLKIDKVATLDQFKQWLSNNNVTVYYILAEPYEVDLGTITTLNTYEGITHISNNSDANMVVNYVDNKLIVTNLGNYISKPVITIKGEGTIEFILNSNKVFRYTFVEGEDEVVIDSQKQDAYLGSVLKNRNMIGEFPIFKVGKNTISWNGYIESIEISSKSRWL